LQNQQGCHVVFYSAIELLESEGKKIHCALKWGFHSPHIFGVCLEPPLLAFKLVNPIDFGMIPIGFFRLNHQKRLLDGFVSHLTCCWEDCSPKVAPPFHVKTIQSPILLCTQYSSSSPHSWLWPLPNPEEKSCLDLTKPSSQLLYLLKDSCMAPLLMNSAKGSKFGDKSLMINPWQLHANSCYYICKSLAVKRQNRLAG